MAIRSSLSFGHAPDGADTSSDPPLAGHLLLKEKALVRPASSTATGHRYRADREVTNSAALAHELSAPTGRKPFPRGEGGPA